MGLDRVQRDEQTIGDFLIGTALRDQLQHCQLPRAEQRSTGTGRLIQARRRIEQALMQALPSLTRQQALEPLRLTLLQFL